MNPPRFMWPDKFPHLKILNDYFEAGEIDVYQKKLLDGNSKVNITPYMEHIFAELKDFTQYRGGLGYLFLEKMCIRDRPSNHRGTHSEEGSKSGGAKADGGGKVKGEHKDCLLYTSRCV